MLATVFASLLLTQPTILIRGGLVYDGSGGLPVRADIRVSDNKIVAVGQLRATPGETLIEAGGLAVAPGFIDAHSHADGRIADDPSAESQIRQGITTAIVGQDGGGSTPMGDLFAKLARARSTLNFAAFAGHNTIRRKVMKEDYKRLVTERELVTMRALLEEDMRAGALGISSGLEYEPGFYSDTNELIALCKVASQHRGIYISHVRDEGNGALASFRELIRIADEAKLPAQISHIKLATAGVWGKAKQVAKLVSDARSRGLDITADIYPYRYWQSTIRVLTLEKDYEDRSVWERALKDVEGPHNVLLSEYTPDKSWVGKTIKEISDTTGKDPIAVIQEIIRETTAPNNGRESIVCTAMIEPDIEAFMKQSWTMFCSDGSIRGTHPRGAGAFPRILGEYIRKRNVLPLQTAIAKMTSLPAKRFSLADRGLLKQGYIADITIFDPKTIVDKATPQRATTFAVGIRHVLINGRPVLLNAKMTAARPGRILRRQANGRVTSAPVQMATSR